MARRRKQVNITELLLENETLYKLDIASIAALSAAFDLLIEDWDIKRNVNDPLDFHHLKFCLDGILLESMY